VHVEFWRPMKEERDREEGEIGIMLVGEVMF
jgi:hypothetical protein